VGDVSKVMDKTCLSCVNWTELLKDFGQLYANVTKTMQLEILQIHIFSLWLAPNVYGLL